MQLSTPEPAAWLDGQPAGRYLQLPVLSGTATPSASSGSSNSEVGAAIVGSLEAWRHQLSKHLSLAPVTGNTQSAAMPKPKCVMHELKRRQGQKPPSSNYRSDMQPQPLQAATPIKWQAAPLPPEDQTAGGMSM